MYPILDVNLDIINFVDVKENNNLFKENYDLLLQNCIPRPVAGYFHRPKAKKGRKPWSIPISLFKDYAPDTDVLFMKCFEEDWRRMTKPKIKEENLAKCKIILKKNYKIMYLYYI